MKWGSCVCECVCDECDGVLALLLLALVLTGYMSSCVVPLPTMPTAAAPATTLAPTAMATSYLGLGLVCSEYVQQDVSGATRALFPFLGVCCAASVSTSELCMKWCSYVCVPVHKGDGALALLVLALVLTGCIHHCVVPPLTMPTATAPPTIPASTLTPHPTSPLGSLQIAVRIVGPRQG